MLTRRSVTSTVYRHWLTVAFLAGFVTDLILLTEIDNLFDNLILLFYAVLATLSLITLYATATERLPGFLNRRLAQLAPLAMQYAFGGLLSGMLIFYGRSGDWVTSAPYLLLIIGVIFGNELIKKRSDRLLYHFALYFIGIFSYVVLVVPVLLGTMGDWVFVGSGVLALLLVSVVVQLVYFLAPNFVQFSMRKLVFMLGGLFFLLNYFYFFNIIPPIPLSLTELEIAHQIERTSAGYRLVMEDESWFERLPLLPLTLHSTKGTFSCFARVYAPTRITADIFHRWEYQDASGDWQTKFRYSYKISGANENGYGGYTTSNTITAGRWRCSVETTRGQVLGRRTFTVDTSRDPGALVTDWR